jgi:hypothetical protein
MYVWLRPGFVTIYLVVWVDDLFCLSDTASKAMLFALLSKTYEFSNLGKLTKSLGTRFVQDPVLQIYTMDKEEAILQLLREEGMENWTPVAAPGAQKILTKDMSPLPADKDQAAADRYRRICGRLIHPMTVCRPDIAQPLSVACRHMANPGAEHIKALERICQYLVGHASDAIWFFRRGYTAHRRDDDEVDAGSSDVLPLHQVFLYADSDFNNDPDGGRSVSGYILFFGGGPISWWSKRQTITTLSSTGAEFVAACEASREAYWIWHYMKELLLPQGPIPLYEDNNGCIAWATSAGPLPHVRGKHVMLRFHYLREQVAAGVVVMMPISTVNQTADILTKSLKKIIFTRLKAKMMNHSRRTRLWN